MQDAQPAVAVPQVRLQVVALGPLVPGFDPQQAVLLGAPGDLFDSGADVRAESLGSRARQD